MKMVNPFIALAATTLFASTPVYATEKNTSPSENIVAKDETARFLHGNDIDSDGYKYYKYYTGSCSCVGDAIADVMDASSAAVDKLPFDSDTHGYLMSVVDGLAHCAVDFLHGLDCGCDNDYTIPQQHALAKSDAKTSTYSCCCDVEAIKEATIHQIESAACSWSVDMNGVYMGETVEKLCGFDFYAAAYARLEYLIKQVGGQYLPALFYDPTDFQCLIPDLDCPGCNIKPAKCFQLGDSSSCSTVFTGTVGQGIKKGNPAGLEPVAEVAVEVWAKNIDLTADGDKFAYFVVKGAEICDSGSYFIYIASGMLKFGVRTANTGGTFIPTTGVAPPTDSEWHHFVGTYDGSEIELYVDGMPTGTAATVNGDIEYDLGGTYGGSSNDDLSIGSYMGSCDLENLQADVAGVCIWDNALSPEKIKAIYDGKKHLQGGCPSASQVCD